MTPQEFHARCAEHDWFWRMADSWAQPHIAAARENESALCALASVDAELSPVWDAWARWRDERLRGLDTLRPLPPMPSPGQLSLPDVR